MMADAIADAAQKNPDKMYAIVDSSFTDGPENTIGVLFKAQEPSFEVGYIAGMMTETNRVGLSAARRAPLLTSSSLGYRAGVALCR